MKTLGLRMPSCPFSSHGFGRARGTFSRAGKKYSRMREHPPERAEHSTTWEEQPLKPEEHSPEREEHSSESGKHRLERENVRQSERNILKNARNVIQTRRNILHSMRTSSIVRGISYEMRVTSSRTGGKFRQSRRKIPPEPEEHFPDRTTWKARGTSHKTRGTSTRAWEPLPEPKEPHTHRHTDVRFHVLQEFTHTHADMQTHIRGGGYTYVFVHTLSTSSQVCSEQEKKWTSSFISNYSWHSQPTMYWILIVCLLKISYNLCVILLFYGINKKLIVTIKKRLKRDTLWR